MDQQIDIFGERHDLAGEHQALHLFESAPQIRGQLAMDTDFKLGCDSRAACPASPLSAPAANIGQKPETPVNATRSRA